MFGTLLYQQRTGTSGFKDVFYVPPAARTALVMRGLFGFTANLSGPLSIKYIPLAKSTVLFYTNPIFIGIFGYFILKERIT